MKPCFGYVRVSTLKQGEGVSLEAQRQAIERFAAANQVEIIRWFEEKVTAAKSGRPEFNAMLKLLRKGRAAGVVMHKIDRSARNFRDWATIGELADAGIDVHFATESLDFRSRGGRLSADIQAVIAADYIRNLKEEVRKGLYGRLQQGIYPFGAPIGYLNNGGGKLKTPDPVKAPLVMQAFELYASGRYSIRTLHAELARRGLRNAKGRPICIARLAQLLSDPFYAGLIRIKRTEETFPGRHEPLIPMQLFETVQSIKDGKSVHKTTRHMFTYRGLFTCRGCGRAMCAERQRGHVYYRCHNRDCKANCIREEQLELAIIGLLQQIKLKPRDVKVIEEKFRRWMRDDDVVSKARSCELQLRAIAAKLDRLTDALIDRLIDEVEFNRRKGKLLREQKSLQEMIEANARDRVDPAIVVETLERLKNLAAHYRFADSQDKREITEIVSSNRTVWAKQAAIEPSNWLQTARAVMAVQCGAHDRNASRTNMVQNKGGEPTKPSETANSLISLASAPEAKRLEEMMVNYRGDALPEKGDYSPNSAAI